MSRIGKMPVVIPKGVEVKVEAERSGSRDPRESSRARSRAGLPSRSPTGRLKIARASDEPRSARMHGLLRSLVANAVEGVTKGFTRELEISGVGYRAEVKGKSVVFSLGYSHPVEFPIPEGIAIAVDAQGRER